MNIFNNDCLEEMKNIKDESIDLVFCDLPYGQTSCKWDCKIDLNLFWKEIMRIKKLNTPIFFTTTTKFGIEIITSAPKKCHFRYDIVWCKSAPAGFLSAKKMPMRKHEMIYVFYEKLPFYDLSTHKHKFIKEDNVKKQDKKHYTSKERASVVKEVENNNKEEQIYTKQYLEKKVDFKNRKGKPRYDPPLPVSIVKADPYGQTCDMKNNYEESKGMNKKERKEVRYDPPLPNSMLEIKSTRGKHSTEKPVALIEWILKYYSKEGDTILDPTMGSGSTGVACKNMNRNFIGIEKDEEIFNVAKSRLNID